jgi:AcrR family transcriptional regulator
MSVNSASPTIRDRQRLETLRRLYDAALVEFRRVGVPAAQVDSIVKAVGVARGTFYFHFPTKEHVLLDLQRQIEAKIVERVARAGRPPQTVKAFLTRIVEAMLIESEALGDDALARELLAMYLRQPVTLDYSAEPLVMGLTTYFENAASAGQVRRDIPAEDLTIHFLVTLFGFFKGTSRASKPTRQTLKNMIEVFLHGISAS